MAPLSKCVGYDWLLHVRNLRPLIWKSSVFLVKSDYVARKLNAQAKSEGQVGVQCIYNKRLLTDYDYLNVIDNLEASFRYEPLDLYLIALAVKSFTHDDIEELENRLARSSSLPLRKIGYYYEALTGNKLHIKPISKRLNIADLIDSSRYFTSAVKSDMTDLEIKWRIRDNTLGKLGVYAPVISRNVSLDVPPSAMSSYIGLLNQFPISIRDNVIDDLYAADSIASFEIEGEPLSAEDARFKRFVKALREIKEAHLTFDEHELSRLQRICCPGYNVYA